MGFLSSISVSSLLALVAATSALSIPNINNQSVKGVLEVPLQRAVKGPTSKGNFTARDNDFQWPIANWDEIGYFTNLSVGTPPQVIWGLIDTGSSDVVIDQSKYTPSASSSSNSVGTSNTGWGVPFQWYTEKVATDEFSLENYNVATWDNNLSLFGIGPQSGEQYTSTYNNLPYALAAAGIINKPAFSVYVSEEPYDDNSYSHTITNGVILFGGIDKAKYVGDLTTYQLINQGWAAVNFDQVGFADGSSYAWNNPAVLDTGTTTSSFPAALVSKLKDLFGPYDSNGNIITYQKSWETTYLSFQFDSSTVQVPYSDFVTHINGVYQFARLYTVSDEDPKLVLGDIFLRNAYTVFNYDAGTISIAQAAKNAYGTSDITVIS